MSNKFLDLSSSPLMNLDHTYRYSGTKLVEAESLSQHIIDTIMLGLKIIDEINDIAGYTMVIPEEYAMKAIYHDLEEAITGDIPRPLKYYNQETLMSLRGVADDVAKEFFESQFNNPEAHYELWENAKEGDAGYILKVVDCLVVAHKVIKEVTLLNNNYMLKVAHEVSGYLSEIPTDYFCDHHVNLYITDIVSGASRALNKIMDEHKDVIESLNICGQSMI